MGREEARQFFADAAGCARNQHGGVHISIGYQDELGGLRGRRRLRACPTPMLNAQKRSTSALERQGNWPALANLAMPCTRDQAWEPSRSGSPVGIWWAAWLSRTKPSRVWKQRWAAAAHSG